ncbi:MAG: DNA-binding protein [Pseudomonas sp.]
MNTLLTPDEAKQRIIDQGISIREFARSNGLDEHTTYQVLSGRKKGRRGEAHKCAVALGIKMAVDEVDGLPKA